MKPSEVLGEAKKLILNEENWTQEVFARNANNEQVRPSDRSACKFCASGAVFRSTDNDTFKTYLRAEGFLILAIPEPYGKDIAIYNDEHTHSEILAVFDRAIALAIEAEAETKTETGA